ncbi:hypothetical protein GCM10027589_07840 [Actinocorallia lasiicapitis]
MLFTSACSATTDNASNDGTPETGAPAASGDKETTQPKSKPTTAPVALPQFTVGPVFPVGPGAKKPKSKKDDKDKPGGNGDTPAPPPGNPAPGAIINETFGGPDRLLTNAYANWNPNDGNSKKSSIWQVTGGSIFVRNGVGYSGYPDSDEPNAESSNGTGSNIFRADTKRRDMKDVKVDLKLRNLGLRSGGPDTDGVHVWLRYQTQFELYVVSLNRRDNSVVIKKKLTGGDSNGGTYHELGKAGYSVPYGAWQSFSVTIRSTEGGGAATITVSKEGRQLLQVTDRGTGGHVITNPGAVGIRADRCEFEFTDFRAYFI